MMYKGYIHNTTRMQDLMSRIIWLLFFFFISLIAYYSYIPGKYTFKSKVRMQCSTQFTPKQTFKTNILILSAYTMFPCWFCAIQCSSYCFLLLLSSRFIIERHKNNRSLLCKRLQVYKRTVYVNDSYPVHLLPMLFRWLFK